MYCSYTRIGAEGRESNPHEFARVGHSSHDYTGRPEVGVDRCGLDSGVAELPLDHFQGGAPGPVAMGGVVRIQPHDRHAACARLPDCGQSSAQDGKSLPTDRGWGYNQEPSRQNETSRTRRLAPGGVGRRKCGRNFRKRRPVVPKCPRAGSGFCSFRRIRNTRTTSPFTSDALPRRVLGQKLFYGLLRRRLVLRLFPVFDERGVRCQRCDLS